MSARSWMLPIGMVAGGMYAGKSFAVGTGGNENAGALAGAGFAIAGALVLRGAGAGVRALLKSGATAAETAVKDGAAETAVKPGAWPAPAMLADKIGRDDVNYANAFGLSRQIEIMRGRL